VVIALDIAPEAADDLLMMIAVHVEPGIYVGEPFLVARDGDGDVTLWTKGGVGGSEIWGSGPGPSVWRLAALRAPFSAELVRWWRGREVSRAVQ
jgi:hypothetical protein